MKLGKDRAQLVEAADVAVDIRGLGHGASLISELVPSASTAGYCFLISTGEATLHSRSGRKKCAEFAKALWRQDGRGPFGALDRGV
jgi:hypothetical protein